MTSFVEMGYEAKMFNKGYLVFGFFILLVQAKGFLMEMTYFLSGVLVGFGVYQERRRRRRKEV